MAKGPRNLFEVPTRLRYKVFEILRVNCMILAENWTNEIYNFSYYAHIQKITSTRLLNLQIIYSMHFRCFQKL